MSKEAYHELGGDLGEDEHERQKRELTEQHAMYVCIIIYTYTQRELLNTLMMGEGSACNVLINCSVVVFTGKSAS